MKNEEKIKISVIIQARMQSKRLPGKSMRLLCGKALISHVIERSLMMRNVHNVILATCEGNEPLVECAKAMGVSYYIGSESNVLERYYLAAKESNSDFIVRVTGDNPFTDIEYGSRAIEEAVKNNADLFSFQGLPIGTGVEIIKFAALEKSFNEAETMYQKEHVSPYIKEHEEIFNVKHEKVNLYNDHSQLRLTVDTVEDLCFAEIICSSLYHGRPFSIDDILDFIKDNPESTQINANVKQREMTHSENAEKMKDLDFDQIHNTFILKQSGNIVCGYISKDGNNINYKASLDEIRKEEAALLSTVLSTAQNNIHFIEQIHTDQIIKIKSSQENFVFSAGQADALITNIPGQVLVVRTADCVPIILFDRKNSIVAAIHSGWRGCYEKISGKVVNMMSKEYGSEPSAIAAYIFPCIGFSSYKVSEDFIEKFPGFVEKIGDDCFFDLRKNVISTLETAGLNRSNILSSEKCTFSDKSLFSHRKGDFGRTLNYVYLKENNMK